MKIQCCGNMLLNKLNKTNMKTKKEIEQLAQEIHYEFQNQGLDANGCFNQYQGYIKGYSQCQEDMTDMKYTEEDIRKAIQVGISAEAGDYPEGWGYKLGITLEDYYINSLNKQNNG